MKASILLLFSFCLPSFLSAQSYTLSGQVLDSTLQPIEGVTVVLLHDQATTQQSVITNNKGDFHFNLLAAGTYEINAIMPGYQTKKIENLQVNGSNASQQIVMNTLVHHLKEAVVRSTKPLIEIKPDKLIVNVENSINSAGSSAMEVLQQAPGVRVDQNDQISLKGKSGVMIWIDGKPSPLSGTDLATILKSMPANSISKIEIISNPGARYDAAGNAGIINIKTKKDQRMGMNGTATANYGQGVYPKYGAGLNLNYRNKKFNAYGSVNYSERYAFNHLFLDRRFLDTAHNNAQLFRYDQDNFVSFNYKTQLANAGIDYAINEKTTIGLSGTYSTNRYNPTANNASRALDGHDNLLYNFKTIGHHNNRFYNYSGNLFLRHSFDSSGRELSVDVDYASFGNNSQQNFITHYTFTDGRMYLPDYYLQSRFVGNTQIKSFKSDFSQPIDAQTKLEVGVKSSFVTADNEPRFYEKVNEQFVLDSKRSNHFIYQENINAIYINANKDWKKWATQLGLRMENTIANWEQRTTQQLYDTCYIQVFPSIALQYHADAKNDWGITMSRRIERPNYQQLNPFKLFIDKTTYKEGYPYLYPASFYSLELSHTYQQKLVTSFTYGINKGMIVEVIQPSDTEDSVTVQTNKNLDQMTFIGLSGSYNFTPFKWWTNNTNINAYYAQYRGNIANTPLNNGKPTFDISMNNSFVLPYNFSAEIGGYYQARQLYGYLDVAPNWMLNIGVQKHLFNKAASIRLNVQDLFWTGYPSATSVYTGYRENFTAKRETRVINLAITYRFGNTKLSPMRRHQSGAEDEKNRAKTNA